MRSRMSGPGAMHVGLFGRPTMFRAGEDGGGGGGGGGGDDDEAKFGVMFNKFFHKAMGEREKRLEAKLMKGLGDTLKSQLDELREAIMADDGGDGQPGQGQPGQGQPGQGQGHADLSPETRAQLKRAEDTAKEAAAKADKWEREAKAASEKARKTEERQMIVSSLNGKVKPALLDMVVDQLHGKHVVRDAEDEAKILWRNGDGELLPFKDGIESWTKSDFGKEVAPPVAARGSGGRGGDGAPGKGEMTADILGGIIAGAIPR